MRAQVARAGYPLLIAQDVATRQHPAFLESRMLVYGLFTLSALLFHYIYYFFSARAWSYMGLLANFDGIRLLQSHVLLVIFILMVPVKNGPRSFFLHCLGLLYLLPAAVLFTYNNFPLFTLALTFLGCFIVMAASAIRIGFHIDPPLPANLYTLLALGLATLLFVATAALGGLANINFDLSQVYNLRDDAAEYLPQAFNYIIPAFTKTLIPFGIATALHCRMRVIAFGMVLISILMFGMTTHKIMLFAPILVFLTYYGLRHAPFVTILAAATAAILAVIALAVLVLGYFPPDSPPGWLESMFVWRSLIVPSFLDYNHMLFFEENTRYWWSTSQITFNQIEAPNRGMGIPAVIGVAMFGDTTLQANTGFIGSGYAQAGLIGVVVYSVGAGLFLSLVRQAADHIAPEVVISASLTLVFTVFMSTDFVGTFLTHGLILACLFLVWLGPPKRLLEGRLGTGRGVAP